VFGCRLRSPTLVELDLSDKLQAHAIADSVPVRTVCEIECRLWTYTKSRNTAEPQGAKGVRVPMGDNWHCETG
jgi:hypothetical protein